MKKIFNIALLFVFLVLHMGVIAQPPPPPADASTNNDYVGQTSGAPVGTADILLVTLAALYGAYRLSSRRKTEEEA